MNWCYGPVVHVVVTGTPSSFEMPDSPSEPLWH